MNWIKIYIFRLVSSYSTWPGQATCRSGGGKAWLHRQLTTSSLHRGENIIERMEDDLQSRAEPEEKERRSHSWMCREDLHSRTGLGRNQLAGLLGRLWSLLILMVQIMSYVYDGSRIILRIPILWTFTLLEILVSVINTDRQALSWSIFCLKVGEERQLQIQWSGGTAPISPTPGLVWWSSSQITDVRPCRIVDQIRCPRSFFLRLLFSSDLRLKFICSYLVQMPLYLVNWADSDSFNWSEFLIYDKIHFC